MKSAGLLFASALVFTAALPGEEPEADAADLPRLAPTGPEEALATFEVRPGFALRLAAHEPEVVDPIAMAFDEEGRLYVLEMRGYSERRDDALGRVRLLTDSDGDGTFDQSTVYRDGLKWPTALACYRGGVFVGASPDVFYFRDTDGDGVADEERHIFTGFGHGNPRLNMQALFNSFRWGPDNRIWGATAANGGTARRPDQGEDEAIALRGRDFSFDPEKLDLRAENGTAQYGMTFDSRGRRFVCSNSRHAIWVAWEQAHLRPNPWYDPPRPLVDIPDDGAAAPVYRISEDEPWRVVRTRWRVAGVVKGMVEGGGRVSGYFTSATGIHAYWGDAFGPDWRDQVFVGDVGSNLVHRKILRAPAGRVEPVATRASDEGETEFLRSRDNWFRPASFATGPDGCLYIADMYREVIEHPWSLPEGIKKHLDLNSGNDRGRIYRVEPTGFDRPVTPRLSQSSDGELRALLGHANDWHRTTARRLLYERGNPEPAIESPAPFPAALASEESLLHLLEEWRGDPWKEAAILNSLRTPGDLLAAWNHPDTSGSRAFAVSLAEMSGRSGDAAASAAVVASARSGPLDFRGVEMILAWRKGLSVAKEVEEGARAPEGWDELLAAAERMASTAGGEGDRVSALRLLRSSDATRSARVSRTVALEEEVPRDVQAEAIRGIRDPSFLLKHLGGWAGESRSVAEERLVRDKAGALALLDSVSGGVVSFSSLRPETTQGLRHHPDKDVAAKAGEVFPEEADRGDVVTRYRPALEIEGDPDRGLSVFRKACLTCHRTHEGEGDLVGPAIETFRDAGGDSLIGNILDPNKEVAPQYQAYTFTLMSGESYAGLIEAEDTVRVTLRMPGGIVKTFPRREVASMSAVGRSLMPDGLEAVITVEEMAHLLAYLAAGG